MGFLAGKKLLITGVLSNRSIAYGIARACRSQGAELAFSYVGERFKDRITEFAADFAVHRCSFVGRTIELRDQAARFDWDSAVFANDNARAAELYARVNALDLTWLDIVSECLCSALLPA